MPAARRLAGRLASMVQYDWPDTADRQRLLIRLRSYCLELHALVSTAFFRLRPRRPFLDVNLIALFLVVKLYASLQPALPQASPSPIPQENRLIQPDQIAHRHDPYDQMPRTTVTVILRVTTLRNLTYPYIIFAPFGFPTAYPGHITTERAEEDYSG